MSEAMFTHSVKAYTITKNNCIMINVVIRYLRLGRKQVEILYEPVAVRYETKLSILPNAADWGKAIGSNPEKVDR